MWTNQQMAETRGQFQRHQTHQNTRAYACDFHECFLPHGKVLRVGNRINSDISSTFSLSLSLSLLSLSLSLSLSSSTSSHAGVGVRCGAHRAVPSHPVHTHLQKGDGLGTALGYDHGILPIARERERHHHEEFDRSYE